MFKGGVKGTNPADIERRPNVASEVGARSGSSMSFGFFGGKCDSARM
jgi:hypothetical protein